MPGGRGDLRGSKMSEWERVFLRNVVLPPHCQRRRTRRPGSTAFRCVLKYLEGAALTQVGGTREPSSVFSLSPCFLPTAGQDLLCLPAGAHEGRGFQDKVTCFGGN